MRLYPISGRSAAKAITFLVLLSIPSALRAQARAETLPSRWSVEAVAIGGPGVLVGAATSFDVFRAASLRLALEASLLVNVWRDNEYAPCPLPPSPCTISNKPPYTEGLRTLALSGEYSLGASWRVVASSGIAAGEWRRPQGTESVVLDLGVGLAKLSRLGGHALVLRGHRIQTHSYATYAARVSWRLRL